MLPKYFEIDQAFDLDEALTMPELINEQHEAEARTQSAADDIRFDEMPTVVPGGDRCGVCMTGFRAGATQVPCGHVFHLHCIAQWASVNSSCPLCRTRLSA